MPNETLPTDHSTGKLFAHSIDYDGCVAGFDELFHINRNINLWEWIRSQAGDPHHEGKWPTVLMIGTNRQSFGIDQYNAGRKRNGSCFPFFKKLTSHLKQSGLEETTLIPLLLADVFGMLPVGESYRRCLSEIESTSGTRHNITHKDTVFDEDKISLIYAQAHELSKHYPNKQITLNFYDDTLSILETLSKHFSRNHQCLPANITLSLRRCESKRGVLSWAEPIKGSGPCDLDYADTLRNCIRGKHYYNRFDYKEVLSSTQIDSVRLGKTASRDSCMDTARFFKPAAEIDKKPQPDTQSQYKMST